MATAPRGPLIIIQARMGSTRLPGKVLEPLGPGTVLSVMLARLAPLAPEYGIVIATTTEPGDDPIMTAGQALGIPVFRGSHHDVLDRYLRCAVEQGAEEVIRLTADCPLIDPQVVRDLTARFHAEDLDYLTNCRQPTFPHGLDVEIMTFAALDRAWREATLASEREHVTPYIWKNPTLFRVGEFTLDPPLPDYRWTIDHPVDLQVVQELVDKVGAAAPFMDYVRHMDGDPALRTRNQDIDRREGYLRSLQEEG